MMLGKREKRDDHRNLRLTDYLTGTTLPPSPLSRAWGNAVPSWPVLGNDVAGDCTCAAAGHAIECWSANDSALHPVTTAEVIALYRLVSGYDPTDPSTDVGAYCLDVLKALRSTGLGGHRIEAFAEFKPGDLRLLHATINLFGLAYVGIGLPLSAQDQLVWDVPAGGPTGDGRPWSWGGHCVSVVNVDPFAVTCVTWGHLQKMTLSFFEAYCDEAYAVLAPEFWTGGDSMAPNGFDLAQLRADLALVTT